MTYREYLQSEHWQAKRTHILLTRGSRCQQCGALGPVHLHHVSYDRLGCERDEDILLLCTDCHRQMHSIGVAEAADAAYEFLVYIHGQPEEH